MIRVNLLTRSPAHRAASARRACRVGLALAMVFALSAGGAVLWIWLRHDLGNRQMRLHVLEARISFVRADTSGAADLEKRRPDLLARLGQAIELEHGAMATVELLTAVSRAVPDGVWLMDLKRQGRAIDIEGRARTVAAVALFAANLRESRAFAAAVDVQSTAAELIEQTAVVRFRIRAAAR